MINFQLSLDSENDPFRTIKGQSLERLLLRTPGAFQESYLLYLLLLLLLLLLLFLVLLLLLVPLFHLLIFCISCK